MAQGRKDDVGQEETKELMLFPRARRPFVPLNETFKRPKGQEEKRTRTKAAAKRNLLFFLADPALAPVFKFTWASHEWAVPSVLDVLTSHPLWI